MESVIWTDSEQIKWGFGNPASGIILPVVNRNVQHEGFLALKALAERQQSLLEEVRRDTKHTQRLWVKLAQKNGWLEEGDLFADNAAPDPS